MTGQLQGDQHKPPERWSEIRRECMQVTCDMIVRCAHAKNHRLPRLETLTDHFHLTIGVPYDVSPRDVVLSYMNNAAFAHGMIQLFIPATMWERLDNTT
jgi:hypothetical protein